MTNSWVQGPVLMNEMDGPIPEHLREWWAQDQPWSLHSAAWWQRHWGRTGILDIEWAEALADGWKFWADWLRKQPQLPANAVRASVASVLPVALTLARSAAAQAMPGYVGGKPAGFTCPKD